MNKYSESILPNGLKVITSENPSSDIVTLSVWVKTGSRYENAGQSGYFHVLEHMLWKGTKRRPTSFKIHLEKDRLGAYSNAETEREFVNFEIQVAAKYAEKMLELLSDVIMNSLFDGNVLKNEVKVVLEELKRDYENYQIKGGILSDNKFFENHPLAKDPWGNEKNIVKAKTDKLKAYRKKFFVPKNSALITSGNLAHSKAVKLAKKYFGKWQGMSELKVKKTPFTAASNHYAYEKADTSKSYIYLNYLTSPEPSLKEAAAFELISAYLNYGHSSLLKQELRNKRGLVYNIRLGHQAYSDAGKFFINTSTAKPKETVDIIIKAIENLTKYFSRNLLKAIKIQTVNAAYRINDNQFNNISFLGKNFIIYNRLISFKEYIRAIESVSYNDILKIAKKYFIPQNRFLFILGPKNVNI